MRKQMNRLRIRCFTLVVIVACVVLSGSYSAEAARGVGESDTFSIDTVTSVLLSCSTHPDSDRRYNHDDPAFSWTTPFIEPVGYYFIFDQHPSTEPTDATGQYILGTQLLLENQSDGTWYLHMVAELETGKLEPYVSHYQVNIDAAPPEVTSASHPVQGEWYQTRQAELSWSITNPSDMANLYYILDNRADTVPTSSTGTATQETRITFNLSDGEWYFHVVWEDLAGNVGEEAAHYAVKVDDTNPPSVTDLTVLAQADGDITLIWTEPVDLTSGVAYYQVYRSEIQGVAGNKLGADGEVTTGQYTDVGAASSGKMLYYTVLPVDRAGNKQTEGIQKAVSDTPTQLPTVSILTPTAGQVFATGTTSTTLSVGMANHTGYWHWKLNESFPISGPADGNAVESGNVATITGLQDGQSYTVHVALVDGDGNILSPAVTTSAAFSVASPPQLADFVVSTLKTEETATAGGYAVYLIKLEGKHGFGGDVELYDSELPSGVEAGFDPKRITLSAMDPLLTSQLTLTLPDHITPGDYPFTVLAVSDSGETKRLALILKVASPTLVLTSLTVILQPVEVPYKGELKLFGQLSPLSDTPVELGGAVIQIIFTAPSGEMWNRELRTDAEGGCQMATPFSPNEVGEWNVKALFEGNAQLGASERERSFNVTKGRSEIVFVTGERGALGMEIMILGNLKPQLEGEMISLKILRPDGQPSTITGIITEAAGAFQYALELDMAGDWEITATWAGNEQYESASQKLALSVSQELGKAILVLGGGDQDDNPGWTTFNRLAEYVHTIFLRRSLDEEEDIRFLSPDPDATEGADTVTSKAALKLAVTDWAQKHVNAQAPLYIYLLSHNVGDQFLLEKRGNQETYLTPVELDEWLSQLPGSTPVTVIIEACYSGNFIRTSDNQPTPLVSPDRTIITSARGDKQAKIMPNRSSFSKVFFDRVGANDTVSEAFRFAEDYMARSSVHREQYPQMDANGDGNINTAQDYAAVAQLYIPTDFVSLAAPPEIIDVTSSQTLPEGVSSLRVSVELIGVNITRVSATVIPPDFDPTQEIRNWSELSFPEFDLAEVPGSDREYAAVYSNFTIPGAYTVIVDAENPDGSAVPVQTTITVPGDETAISKGDVNGDGAIRSNDAILALRIAAGLMTPSYDERQAADMNGDGAVRSNDAILILRAVAGLAAPVKGVTASAGGPVTVTLSRANGTAGGSVTVAVTVDNVCSMLAGGDICIAYDSSALRPVEFSSDSDVLLAPNASEPGIIRFAFASVSGLSSQTLAEIEFDVLADGISPLELKTVELYSPDALPMDVRKLDGQFSSWAIAPERSALLQNFPNPFNPETWIPYQLREDSKVTIRIYSVAGDLLRELALGYMPAGLYTSSDRAAHWDGRNTSGERVASGVYFYTIRAGDYTAIEKMVVAE